MFNADGKLKNELRRYADAMKEVGARVWRWSTCVEQVIFVEEFGPAHGVRQQRRRCLPLNEVAMAMADLVMKVYMACLNSNGI